MNNMPKINIGKALPKLLAMESKRKRKLISFWDYLILGIILCNSFIFLLISFVFFTDFTIFASNNKAFLFIFLTIVLIGGLSLQKAFSVKKDFLKEVKQKCMTTALSAFGDIRWLKNDGGLSKAVTFDELQNSQLFGKFSHMRTDDEFEGLYKNVSYKISEVSLFKKLHVQRGTTLINVFQGIVISFEVNKNIKNRTIISMKGDLTNRNSWRLGIVQLLLIFPPFFTLFMYNIWVGIFFLAIILTIVLFLYRDKVKLKKINIEDTEFSKIFDIYSSDEVEARYFLTTAFAERLKNLKTSFGTKKIKCTQLGNEFMIAISTKKDLFEIGSLFHPLDEKSFYEIYRQLYSICNMIDVFNFDKKIGL